MNRFAYIRKYEYGLTQHRLAKMIGCHRTTISKIEHGNKTLFLNRAQKLCEILDFQEEPEKLLEEIELA